MSSIVATQSMVALTDCTRLRAFSSRLPPRRLEPRKLVVVMRRRVAGAWVGTDVGAPEGTDEGMVVGMDVGCAVTDKQSPSTTLGKPRLTLGRGEGEGRGKGGYESGGTLHQTNQP